MMFEKRLKRAKLVVAVTVATALLFMVTGTANSADEIETRKAEVIRESLRKLGRPTEASPLYEAAAEAEALLEIQTERKGTESVITILTTNNPVYECFLDRSANRFIVDIYNTINFHSGEDYQVEQSPVLEHVRTSLYQLDPQFVSRVVFDLSEIVKMRVTQDDGRIIVRVPDDGADRPETVPPSPSVAELTEKLKFRERELAAAEEKLKAEVAAREAAEKQRAEAIARAQQEADGALSEQRVLLTKAQDELRAQIQRRETAEGDLKAKLDALTTEYNQAIAKQQQSLDEAQAKFEQEAEKRAEAETKAGDVEEKFKQQQVALAGLKEELSAKLDEETARASALQAGMMAKEEEAQRTIDEREQALKEMEANVEAARAENERMRASLAKQIEGREAEVRAELDRQKLALAEAQNELAKLSGELETQRVARKDVETKLAQELASREKESAQTISDQMAALKEAQDKAKEEAEARAVAEAAFKKELTQLAADADADAQEKKLLIAKLEEQLASERTARETAEQKAREAVASMEEQTKAATAEAEKAIAEAELQLASKRKEEEDLAKEAQVIAQKEAEARAIAEAELEAKTEQLAAEQAAREVAELAASEAAAEIEELAKVAAAAEVEKPPAAAGEERPSFVEVLKASLTAATEAVRDQVVLQPVVEAEAAVEEEEAEPVAEEPEEAEPEAEQPETIEVEVAKAAEAVVPPAPAPAPAPPVPPEEQTVTVTFRDADINSVIDVWSRMAGINVLAGKDVRGTVTCRLRDVPVLDAMRLVLKDNGYALVRDGNIYRVVPEAMAAVEILAEMETRTFKLEYQTADSMELTLKALTTPHGKVISNKDANVVIVTDEPENMDRIEDIVKELDVSAPVVLVVTGVYPLSYAKAVEVAKIIEGVLTEHGSVVADPRSNQVLVTDVPENLQTIDELIPTLDQREPQAFLEVMIVDHVLQDDSAYGINWLANARDMTNDLQSFTWNSTGLGDSVGSEPLDAGVLTFGVLTDDFDLTAAIAGELQNRNAKLVANPSTLVLNNQQASIEMVSEYPFQQLTQTTQGPPVANIEFKNIGVTLQVTPQITSDQSIIVDLDARESSISGFSEGVPIEDSRTARTTLLINNGQTIYLAGLRSISVTADSSRFPMLGSIPLVGIFFREATLKDSRTELLVFLTVHVVLGDAPDLTPYQRERFEQLPSMSPVPDGLRNMWKDISNPLDGRKPPWQWKVKKTKIGEQLN